MKSASALVVGFAGSLSQAHAATFSDPLAGGTLNPNPAILVGFAASYEWFICCCASLSRRITSPSVVWAKST